MNAKHVLLVDDEKRIREVVEYALEKSGYRVSAVADGALALAALERDPADLVVLDIMLPGVDGWEVCRRIRAKSVVPILFLSARSDEVDRIVGLELGGDDYLVKPFSPRELFVALGGAPHLAHDAINRFAWQQALERAAAHGLVPLEQRGLGLAHGRDVRAARGRLVLGERDRQPERPTPARRRPRR